MTATDECVSSHVFWLIMN